VPIDKATVSSVTLKPQHPVVPLSGKLCGRTSVVASQLCRDEAGFRSARRLGRLARPVRGTGPVVERGRRRFQHRLSLNVPRPKVHRGVVRRMMQGETFQGPVESAFLARPVAKSGQTDMH
jgi:hypothetical protein